jgi:deoxyribodipyrimidine photo-lyase
LQDNEAIFNATKNDIPTLLLYVFEKSLENDAPQCKMEFIKQSIVDLNKQLEKSNTKYAFHLR